jgi:uncharacterized protein YndB with AHSA1/START domain
LAKVSGARSRHRAKKDAFKTEVLSPGPRLRVFALVPEGEAHLQFIFSAATFSLIWGTAELEAQSDWFLKGLEQGPNTYEIHPAAREYLDLEEGQGVFHGGTFLVHFAKEENRGLL